MVLESWSCQTSLPVHFSALKLKTELKIELEPAICNSALERGTFFLDVFALNIPRQAGLKGRLLAVAWLMQKPSIWSPHLLQEVLGICKFQKLQLERERPNQSLFWTEIYHKIGLKDIDWVAGVSWLMSNIWLPCGMMILIRRDLRPTVIRRNSATDLSRSGIPNLLISYCMTTRVFLHEINFIIIYKIKRWNNIACW